MVNPQQLLPAQRDLIARSVHTDLASADPAFLNDFTAFLKNILSAKAQTGYADYIVASPGYFHTLHIPLLKGRVFSDADGPEAPQVAVISESLARQKWPNHNAIGHTIEFGNMDGDLRLLTIVGVVGDVHTRNLETAPRPTVYVDFRQRPRATSDFQVALRTNAALSSIIPVARKVLSELDPSVPPRFSTYTQIFSESLNSRRFNLLLVAIFAGTALVLALAGVFGVLAYSVAQRTREIGVRIALGATTGKVLKMVMVQGIVTAAAGTAAGLLGALILTRTMRSLLFETSPTDPLTLICVALLLLLISALASYIPARRATRVDPIIALRYE